MTINLTFEAYQAFDDNPLLEEEVQVEVQDNFFDLPFSLREQTLRVEGQKWLANNIVVTHSFTLPVHQN